MRGSGRRCPEEDTFGAGLESDRHTMLVAATDECHGAAGKAEIACVDIGGHIYAGEMADVHRAIGVWERGGDECAYILCSYSVGYVRLVCLFIESAKYKNRDWPNMRFQLMMAWPSHAAVKPMASDRTV